MFEMTNWLGAARSFGDKKRGRRVRVVLAGGVLAPSPVGPQMCSAIPGVSSSGSLGEVLWYFRALRSKNEVFFKMPIKRSLVCA